MCRILGGLLDLDQVRCWLMDCGIGSCAHRDGGGRNRLAQEDLPHKKGRSHRRVRIQQDRQEEPYHIKVIAWACVICVTIWQDITVIPTDTEGRVETTPVYCSCPCRYHQHHHYHHHGYHYPCPCHHPRLPLPTYRPTDL